MHVMYFIERHHPVHKREWVPTGEIYNEVRGPVEHYIHTLDATHPGQRFRAEPVRRPHGDH